MAIVTAMTYPDNDRELPARKVTGKLTTRYVAALSYTQYWVGGEAVDPATIRPAGPQSLAGDKSKKRRKRRRA